MKQEKAITFKIDSLLFKQLQAFFKDNRNIKKKAFYQKAIKKAISKKGKKNEIH
jgi:hypothetical protein